MRISKNDPVFSVTLATPESMDLEIVVPRTELARLKRTVDQLAKQAGLSAQDVTFARTGTATLSSDVFRVCAQGADASVRAFTDAARRAFRADFAVTLL